MSGIKTAHFSHTMKYAEFQMPLFKCSSTIRERASAIFSSKNSGVLWGRAEELSIEA
jgi:hypothetical protein